MATNRRPARGTPKTPRTIQTLDQILAAMVEYRVGLERSIKDPKELEEALAATDEISRNLRELRDDRFRAVKVVDRYVRRNERHGERSCNDGALYVLKILEG